MIYGNEVLCKLNLIPACEHEQVTIQAVLHVPVAEF